MSVDKGRNRTGRALSGPPMNRIPIVRTVEDLRAAVAAWRAEGLSVGFAPTMGALHEGHLSLVRLAKDRCDRCVASVFVNPAQFSPGEDLDAYPRDEAGDAAKLSGAGCDLLYAPAPEAMYPEGFATTVTVAGVSEGLCGASRPGHFAGVATVVAKLLNQVRPDAAVFGEKDYQQLQLIRRMVRDLDFGVEIIGAPTQREADGLALSSRNAYLDESQRRVAGRLNVILRRAAEALGQGARVDETLDKAKTALNEAGFDCIDYLEARAAAGLALQGPGPVGAPTRVFAAVFAGKTRLIDNVAAPE